MMFRNWYSAFSLPSVGVKVGVKVEAPVAVAACFP